MRFIERCTTASSIATKVRDRLVKGSSPVLTAEHAVQVLAQAVKETGELNGVRVLDVRAERVRVYRPAYRPQLALLRLFGVCWPSRATREDVALAVADLMRDARVLQEESYGLRTVKMVVFCRSVATMAACVWGWLVRAGESVAGVVRHFIRPS